MMKRLGTVLVLAAALGALTGCPKEGGGSAAAADAGGVTAASKDDASAAAVTVGDAGGRGPSTAGATGAAASYVGTYTATPATLYIPDHKDYASVKQAKSDETKLVGEGALSVAVGADGRVTGTIDSGPASPAVLDGTLHDDEIRGTVRRKDPADQGLTGVFLGKVSGGKVDGTLELADANAALLRNAKFSAEKK